MLRAEWYLNWLSSAMIVILLAYHLWTYSTYKHYQMTKLWWTFFWCFVLFLVNGVLRALATRGWF